MRMRRLFGGMALLLAAMLWLAGSADADTWTAKPDKPAAVNKKNLSTPAHCVFKGNCVGAAGACHAVAPARNVTFMGTAYAISSYSVISQSGYSTCDPTTPATPPNTGPNCETWTYYKCAEIEGGNAPCMGPAPGRPGGFTFNIEVWVGGCGATPGF